MKMVVHEAAVLMFQLFGARVRPPSRMAGQAGVALFVTIVLTTVALVIMAAITYRHQLDTVRNSRALISEQAIMLALSAESWAKSILRNDAEDNDIDSLDDDWAQAIPVLPVEGGLMTGCILDMQSKYNLNNLGSFNENSFREALQEIPDDNLEIYLSILEEVGVEATEDRAAVITDWIDADSELIAPGSAEDSEYSFQDPPRLAANAVLTSVNELVTVYGYSLADIRVLDRFVTALPFETPINVNTADDTVLLSLSTLIDEFMVESIVEGRPYDDADEFYDAIEQEITYMTRALIQEQLPAELFDVSSNYFELRAQVSIAGENIALKSVFERQGGNAVKTISRSFQYIPDLILDEDDENPIPPLCDQNYGVEEEEE